MWIYFYPPPLKKGIYNYLHTICMEIGKYTFHKKSIVKYVEENIAKELKMF